MHLTTAIPVEAAISLSAPSTLLIALCFGIVVGMAPAPRLSRARSRRKVVAQDARAASEPSRSAVDVGPSMPTAPPAPPHVRARVHPAGPRGRHRDVYDAEYVKAVRRLEIRRWTINAQLASSKEPDA